jgi:hypothetical protein
MTDVFWLNKADFMPVAKVSNGAEMAQALRKAPKEVVKHHIRNGKNDFAAWALNSLKNKPLADRLLTIKADNPKALELLIDAFSGKK